MNYDPASDISGELKCGDSGISGAIIRITGLSGEDQFVTTDNSGSYDTSVTLNFGTFTIKAIYDGDNEHDPASATRTVTALNG